MCKTCTFAIQCLALAITDKAVERALSGYRAHLLRDHHFTETEANIAVSAARMLAPEGRSK